MSKMTRDRLAHIDLFPSSPGCWRRQRAVVRGHYTIGLGNKALSCRGFGG